MVSNRRGRMSAVTHVSSEDGPLEETFAALRALAGLADRAEAQGWAKLAAALRATVEAVEGRLRSPEVAIVVAGGRAKRTLFNVLAADVLFLPDAQELASTFLMMRRARRAGYVARMHDGRLEDFARKQPDRAAWFEREIARAEKELEAAKLRIATLDVELTAKEETLSERRVVATERLHAQSSFAEQARALYMTILTYLIVALRIQSRPRLPAPAARRAPGDARVVSAMIARRDVERSMEGAEVELSKRRAEVERIRAEAARHDEQRRKSFVTEVRTLTDAAQRGGEVIDLVLEVEEGILPQGMVIIDAPAAVTPGDSEVRQSHLRDLRDRASACFLVAAPGSVAIGELEDAVRPIVPHVLDASDEASFAARLREALPSLFERARSEAPLSALALALADMPARMQALASAVAAGEAEHKTRILALERDRLPEPGQFRDEQLARMAGAIDEGARRVLKRAQDRLRARAAELEREWVSVIEACDGWATLKTQLARVDESATERFNQLLDGVGEDIGSEMQVTSELLQVWVLEEVRQRYKTRYLHADKTALVIAELPSEEIAALERPILSRVLRGFERTRFGIAFGSLATGAGIGGAIHAATGAAIGAAAGLVAGVVASLVPRTQALKNECTTAIRAHVGKVEESIAAWLEGSCGTFARDIRAAVDDTLGDALKRRDQSIIRLIDLEGEALEREHEKLRALTDLKSALDEHAARFARLAETAAAALCEQAARRFGAKL